MDDEDFEDGDYDEEADEIDEIYENIDDLYDEIERLEGKLSDKYDIEFEFDDDEDDRRYLQLGEICAGTTRLRATLLGTPFHQHRR